MKHHIYLLRDPRTEAVRYVGVSAHPRERLQAHVSQANRARTGSRTATPADAWIASILADETLPVMQVIEAHKDRSAALDREAHWIRFHHRRGAALFNVVGVPGRVRAQGGGWF